MIIMNFAYNKTKSPICLSTTENLPSIFTRQRDFIIEVKVIYDLYSGAYNTFVMYRSFSTNYSILLFVPVLCLKNNFICLKWLFFFVSRDDQFGSDLLPEEVPVLLDQLPEDDRQNIEE